MKYQIIKQTSFKNAYIIQMHNPNDHLNDETNITKIKKWFKTLYLVISCFANPRMLNLGADSFVNIKHGQICKSLRRLKRDGRCA